MNLGTYETLEQWISAWKARYDFKRYGQDHDRYSRLMKEVADASDTSLQAALLKLFNWKDQISSRWKEQIKSVTFGEWKQWKQGKVIPSTFDHGLVYNVFLLHAATNGKRPMIDQHAWRGYCYLLNRAEKPEFPTYRMTAEQYYLEYERWLQERTSRDNLSSRDLDMALMAYGKSVKKK